MSLGRLVEGGPHGVNGVPQRARPDQHSLIEGTEELRITLESQLPSAAGTRARADLIPYERQPLVVDLAAWEAPGLFLDGVLPFTSFLNDFQHPGLLLGDVMNFRSQGVDGKQRLVVAFRAGITGSRLDILAHNDDGKTVSLIDIFNFLV